MSSAVPESVKFQALKEIEQLLVAYTPVIKIVDTYVEKHSIHSNTVRNWIDYVRDSWVTTSERPNESKRDRRQAIRMAEARIHSLHGARAQETMRAENIEARLVHWSEHRAKLSGMLGPEGEQLGQVAEVRMFLPAPGGYAGPGFERSCPHCGECIEEDEAEE